MARLTDVAGRVRARLRAVLGFSLVFGVLEAAVVAPLGALLLRLFLSQSGKASAGNFEIAQFLLSVTGALALVAVGAVVVAGLYLHLAGLLRILGDPPATVSETIRGLLRDGPRLLRLGALEILAGVLLAAPLVLGMLLAVKGIWGDRDLNGLLVLKPPVFWYGVAAAAVPALLLAFLLVRLLLRWLFALPILLEEPGVWPYTAMRRSAERTRGRAFVHLRALGAWALVVIAGTAVLQGGFALLAGWLLDRVGTRMAQALPATAVVLVVWAALALVLSWIAAALLAGLIDRLHREATGRPPATALPAGGRPPLTLVWRVLGVLGVTAALTGIASFLLLLTQTLSDGVEVTAHRMGAHAAPENTLAALRHAIEEGAEWAELDVQLTSDGGLVVLHDFDLVRIGGPAKRVADATFEEVRALDVGRGLRMTGFEGEKVPTLEEVIAAAGDRIRLNIELKPPTVASEVPLTDATVAAIRQGGIAGRCRVCSQSYAAIRRAKELEPKIEIGYIAGAAIGDLSTLKVDFLMVNAKMATGRFVRRAHANGIRVHPWTVNDPDALPALLDHGVDNVITDAPAAMRARLDEVRGLTAPDRLLLRARNLLAN